MNHITQIFGVEEVGACSGIAAWIPVELTVPSQTDAQQESSDIELPAFKEEQIRFIFLNDGRATEILSNLYCLTDLIKWRADKDVPASIWILSRFHNPKVIYLFLILSKLSLKIWKITGSLRTYMVGFRYILKQLSLFSLLETQSPQFYQRK